MISAEEARAKTLENWANFVEEKINKGVDNQKNLSDGIKDIPDTIKEDLVKNGYYLRDVYGDGSYHTINWWEK